MASMEDFYTLATANEGRRLPLRTADGKPTDHWLQIRSQWSDAFRESKAEAERAISAAIAISPDDAMAESELRKLDLLASLVCAWSFDIECTHKAAREFLRNAPQIAQKVNTFAGDDVRFFKNGSANSTAGPEQSSNFGKHQKGQASR